MKKIAVIPARYGSTRFPGKPLANIWGKPMIQHVYERVIKANLDSVIVASDDERILNIVETFGGVGIMTGKNHLNGSSRIAEVIHDMDIDIVINVQGDEPTITPEAINKVISAFDDETCLCATLKSEITNSDDLNDPNVVKVITDVNDNAIYFSRSVIPYDRNSRNGKYYKHIGIYGYKKDFLLKYVNMPPTDLELMESLEQLRIIENAFKIKVVETDENFIGIDTPSDLKKLEDRM